MKPIVKMRYSDKEYNKYFKGDIGYIDGYITGNYNQPLIIVIIIRTKIPVIVTFGKVIVIGNTVNNPELLED